MSVYCKMFARSFKHAGNIASEVAIYRPQFEAVQQDALKRCNGSDKASWLSTETSAIPVTLTSNSVELANRSYSIARKMP